jgi:5'-AMP-activated protein kinase catalytic alpha subunit
MEYCEGKDLMDYILAKTRLSELESLKFFQQLINALFYLHSQNICHRDVKIDNMLLDRNRDLKLVDFGLSTKYTDDTLLDQPCGTVVYAAPEVLDGNEYHGMLADVWSSGIVLFGMTSGYLPFCDQDDEVNKKHVLEGKIELPDFFSPMLKDLLRHMLDINPITRYTLQDIREHPWFNMNDTNLIPGIIIGYNLIPVDENILNLCVAYNSDRDKIEDSVRNNKYDEGSALYYLLVRKIIRKGFESISDLSSDLFIDFILDDNNLVHPRRDKRRQKNNSVQMNRNNSKSLHKSNNTFENNYRNDLTPSTLNNKDISSSSKHIDDLGAAPRLIPPMNNNKIDKFKGKKENLLEKKKRKNKVNSVSKNNQYPGKNNDELSKKNIFLGEKNKLKNKNMVINKNNNNNNDNNKGDDVSENDVAKNKLKIAVAYALDNVYVYPTLVSMTSLVENAANNTFYSIYVLIIEEFTDENKNVIKSVEEKHNQSCEIIFINMADKYKGEKTDKRIKTPAYYKLSLHDLLPNINRIIWLDGDTGVFGDLTELINLDMKDNYIMGFWDSVPEAINKFGIPNSTVLCTGVLLMNLDALRKNNMTEKFNNFMVDQKENINQHDQTIINVVCQENIGLLPPRYGMWCFEGKIHALKHIRRQRPHLRCSEEDFLYAYYHPIIMHFVWPKPYWRRRKPVFNKQWWDYAKKSGYYKEISTKSPKFIRWL